MVEGRQGSPLTGSWVPPVDLRRLRAGLSLGFAVLLLTIAAANVPPTRALPTPTTNVGIGVGPGNARSPSVAVDTTGRLHATYSDDVSGERGVYYVSSADGSAWSAPVRIDPAGSATYFPRIAVEREPVPGQGDVAGEIRRFQS